MPSGGRRLYASSSRAKCGLAEVDTIPRDTFVQACVEVRRFPPDDLVWSSPLGAHGRGLGCVVGLYAGVGEFGSGMNQPRTCRHLRFRDSEGHQSRPRSRSSTHDEPPHVVPSSLACAGGESPPAPSGPPVRGTGLARLLPGNVGGLVFSRAATRMSSPSEVSRASAAEQRDSLQPLESKARLGGCNSLPSKRSDGRRSLASSFGGCRPGGEPLTRAHGSLRSRLSQPTPVCRQLQTPGPL